MQRDCNGRHHCDHTLTRAGSGTWRCGPEATFNSFTLKTSDGHHLTMHSEGTIASGGQSCTFVDDATATK